MKPLLFWWTACVAIACGGLHKSESNRDSGVDSSLAATDLASDIQGSDALGSYGTCPIGDGAFVSVPPDHRATGVLCSTTRAPTTPIDADGCSSNEHLKCLSDADCIAGQNGRCFEYVSCTSECTYDECFSDSDCPSKQPCICRSSDSDWQGNACLAGGNCATDSDCGPCGFCSPSMQNEGCSCVSTRACAGGGSHCYVGSTEVPCMCSGGCGYGYFCHTSADACMQRTDCNEGFSACAFDSDAGNWSCHTCIPIMQ
jgi:hypothetical protein